VTGPGPDLDPVIHAPVRLRIMVTLVTLPGGDSLSFPRLQQLLGLTAGNLITHLRKLEEAGYVASAKSQADGEPRTTVQLTLTGRIALERYTAALQSLLGPLTGQSSGARARVLPSRGGP
jgi:DNA-binding MarR family transcriptional regulator